MVLFDRSSTLAATLSNSQRGKGCIPYDPNATAPTYGYDPDLGAGIVFTVVFFLSMLAHIIQVTVSRKWWYSALALGAFGMLSWQRSNVTNLLTHCSRRVPWLGRESRCPSLSIQQDFVLSSDFHPRHLYAYHASDLFGFH